jgi:hypothetical protein
MSFIVRSLELMFQSPEEIEEEAREQRQVLAPARKQDGDPPVFRCRACGLESPERAYCPECLADTMVPIKASRT